MQLVSSRIRTRVAVCISYDGNHYTTGTSSHTALYPIDEVDKLCVSRKRRGLASIEDFVDASIQGLDK